VIPIARVMEAAEDQAHALVKVLGQDGIVGFSLVMQLMMQSTVYQHSKLIALLPIVLAAALGMACALLEIAGAIKVSTDPHA